MSTTNIMKIHNCHKNSQKITTDLDQARQSPLKIPTTTDAQSTLKTGVAYKQPSAYTEDSD